MILINRAQRFVGNLRRIIMKRIIAFSALCFIVMSCAVTNISIVQEDQIFMTRRYAGNFIEYSYTHPDKFGNPHLIWIKTTLEDTYGEISAYSKNCNFQAGERLYIRRIYSRSGSVFGSWIYQIESDINKTRYTLSQFRYENKILVQSLF
jgi:hypothetical protein